ncbi:MAG: peptidoglycan DD-metalloendopeptidase family protein [Betaproteobacteria bacterium]|nr:peptidoglycan DD-metalloendopeptidase family protein [Betaproteobacteria bacterium]
MADIKPIDVQQGNVSIRKIGATLAFALAFVSGVAQADKQQELRQLRERIQKLQSDLVKSEESRSEAADALKTSEKAISEVNRNLVALGLEQAQISQSLADLNRRIEGIRADAAQQQELLDRMVRHQYMHGNTDGLRLLLEGKDVSEVERQMHYFGYVSKMRAVLIGRLRKSAASLAELELATRQKQQDLAANANEQRKARGTLQAERLARQKMFVRIKADISKGRREIGRLKRDEDRLGKLIEQLAKAIARNREERRNDGKPGGIPRKGEAVENVADGSFAGRAFQTLKGKLKLPVRGELRGRFGSPREDGGVTWKGLFIKADNGHAVHAVADGQVVYADWLRGFGNLLIVDHGSGYMSLYGNNESLLKNVGDATQSGETVASVGSSGGALESGVYFELRHEGKPFDPMRWVGK